MMPISREQWAQYPSDWKQRRARILERAGCCCEECGVSNGAVGYREADGRFVQLADSRESAGMETETASAADGLKVIEIVLTIAHLDRTGAPGPDDGPLDCPDDRLSALCQRCHLRLDGKRHAAKAAATRARRKYECQPALVLEVV